MTNRRQFLQIGIASSSLPLAAAAKASALGNFFQDFTRRAIPFYRIVADNRYPESMAFAEEMHRRGFDIHELKDDGELTELWMEDLSEMWKTHPVAVAGVTNFRPLFCLEQLGRTYGTRVVYRGQHAYEAGGQVAHRLHGPENMMARCRSLNFRTAASAGESLAELISGCESGRTEIVDAGFAEHTGHNHPLTDARAKRMRTSYAGLSNILIDTAAEQTLTSWIVAPAQQAV